MQFLLLLKALLDLPVLSRQLPLNYPQLLAYFLNLDQALLVLHLNLGEFFLQLLLILPQALDGLLVLLVHSSLSLYLVPQFVDGLLEEYLVVE